MSWAKKHDKCVKCGRTESRHAGRGLCTVCYGAVHEQRHKAHISGRRRFRRDAAAIASDNLRREYVDEHMSLTDLARRYNCTRQYIHKLLKREGIERRDGKTARALAMKQNKLRIVRFDDKGQPIQLFLQKTEMNRSFFRFWSPQMAYVLGVIFTDGNIIPGSQRDPSYKSRGSRLSITQKEPELLAKVLALMECNAKVYQGRQTLTDNLIHQFNIASEELYEDLLNLGLTPKKSRTMPFPGMPGPYTRHFIRGCWDGDGSVYFDKNGRPAASFISGSHLFVRGIVAQLERLGMPPRTIHYNKTGRAYYFRYSGDEQCGKLFHIFYDDVPDAMALSRKYKPFRDIAARHQGTRAVRGGMLPVQQNSSFLQPIPVRADGDYSQFAESSSNFEFAPQYDLRDGVRSHFVFPEPFTRSSLAHMLKISPHQVTRVVGSMPILSAIQKLSEQSNRSSKEYKNGVRALKSQVNMFLYGWDDGGWDDLD
jgi:Intein/homing endonuclease